MAQFQRFGGLSTVRKRNLTGEAVQEIGHGLSQLDLPKKEDAEPNKTDPSQLAKLEEAVKEPNLGSDFNFITDQLETKGLPELGILKPRPTPSIQVTPASNPNTNPYGTTVEGPEHAPWLENQTSFPSMLPGFPAQEPMGPTNKLQENTRSRGRTRRKAEQTHGRGVPRKSEYSPLNRNVGVDFEMQELSTVKGGSRGAQADIRGAFADGYNPVIERHNYKQKVWADKAREADEEMGKLEVEPSGVSNWDASVENMAREWKTELSTLLGQKGEMDPLEYAQKKQDILARSKQFNTASQQLQKVVADYNENLDNISPSTDSKVMDLLNTLNKGGGDIQVGNVNGIPTLSGTTLQGNNISIPISEIASGRNSFRFNTKANIQPQLNQITGNLSKLKRDFETRQGAVVSGPLAWQQLEGTAGQQVDSMLGSNSTVRSILADQFGYDYDDYENMFGKDGDKARAFAKDMLMEQLQQQFQPVSQTQTIKRGSQTARTTPKSSVSERDYARQVQTANQALTKDFVPGDPASYSKLGYETITMDNLSKDNREAIEKRYGEDGAFVIKQGKRTIVVPKNASREFIARNLFEVEPGDLSPLQRKSPMKRLTDWMGITK